MNSDPFQTQRDAASAAVEQLSAAGFRDAEVIGHGGFGIVFRCHQEALDRTVAVKVLTADLDEDRDRFLREQRVMGRLTGHPNIVGVLQVGQTEGGLPYLVMQYHQQGSLEARLKRVGRLSPNEAMRLGVKMAGALQAAHRLDIVHRDVKPANILITDFGEPALSDFGIAHIAGGFETAAGTFTGSPAYTAPEILSGAPPSRASDVYGLGATLFTALTGHAAFERQSGEHMVAQFLRMANEPVPDLRATGIPDDVAAAVEAAMARDPEDRPDTATLAERLRQLQTRRGLIPDTMAVETDQYGPLEPSGGWHAPGNLPLELTSFVGRRAELADVGDKLSTSRLVTVTGFGGVGKTRLALRAATDARQNYPDGVWMVELGELRDPLLVTDVVSATIGLRDETGRSLHEVLIDFLRARTVLLLFDNCEQVVDEVAKLVDVVLRHCPEVHILATSRERLGLGAETILQLTPLPLPDTEAPPSIRGLPRHDAVALFADRAATAVPGFSLTAENIPVIAGICARVDGLPLAIELAAARLSAMSAEQILERLADRYQLLTHGRRDSPQRQQSLLWSVEWSFGLCTPSEQRLWTRLSLFSGGFDLAAAEQICNGDLAPDLVIDLVGSLADKSIVIRTDTAAGVRFRMLDTLRDYGRAKLDRRAIRDLRRKHLHWYKTLVVDAAADWFSSRQLDWIHRIELETPNLRAAGEFALTDSPRLALAISAGLVPYAVARGYLNEMNLSLKRALDAAPHECSTDRIAALYGATIISCLQGDLSAARARVTQARPLVTQVDDPLSHGLVSIADAFCALVTGQWSRAFIQADHALAATENPTVQVPAMVLMGRVLEHQGDVGQALIWQERALATTEAAGEVMFRSYVLWSLGVGWLVNGKPLRAQQLLRECLDLSHQIPDPRNGSACLEALAWIAQVHQDGQRAAVLMGAAQALGSRIGVPPAVLPDLAEFHDRCFRDALETLGDQPFEAAYQCGLSMDFDQALAYEFSTE